VLTHRIGCSKWTSSTTRNCV